MCYFIDGIPLEVSIIKSFNVSSGNVYMCICTLSLFFSVPLSHIYSNIMLLLLLSRSVVSDSVRPHRRQPTRLL